jgi:hypothetical protein
MCTEVFEDGFEVRLATGRLAYSRQRCHPSGRRARNRDYAARSVRQSFDTGEEYLISVLSVVLTESACGCGRPTMNPKVCLDVSVAAGSVRVPAR